MVLSVRTKLKIFIAVLLVAIIAIGGGFAYVNFHMKTPEYTLNAVKDAVENHDMDEFNKYVDVDNLVSGVADNMMNGIISAQGNLPEDAKATMNSLATMFKAPLIASLNSGLNTYVKTGSWQSGELTQDSQGATINSDMILEQAGLSNLTFEGIDSITVDEENKTAEAGIKAMQSEINQEFVFNVTLEQQTDGYWKIVSVNNFADFMKVLEDGRRQYIKKYLEETSMMILDKEKALADSEASLNATLNMGALGNDSTRNDLKATIENDILPQLNDLQSSLQAVEVPKAAETLHNLRLKACETKIAYYQNYAKWLGDKDIKSLRDATDNLKKFKTMEHEADLLTKRIQSQAE